ncbi:hypothetical protein [Streptomyces sp. NBC_01304]|uniref:hypothetical protein n=1 Tax=Streptomyces sp. NBC_01304 TaxID=2903818 RepID=UPI002E0E76B6|nr:hypothetical protein OG430_36640 [Streptomyces sp. NBC_01304]
MDDISLPHKGWGKGSVRVAHAPVGTATVLEIQGSRLSNYYVYGLVETATSLEQGGMLASVCFSGERLRAVVPREYTHVKISPPSNSAGIVRWKLGFRPGDGIRELTGEDPVRGSHPDVLRWSGGPAELALEVGKGYARVHHCALSGARREEVRYVGEGPFRGTLKVPGPGLIEVDCLVAWSLQPLKA